MLQKSIRNGDFMKKINLFLIIALVFALLFAVSCSDAICTSHTDNDADGKCDSCGNAIGNQPCTECSDTDGDGKCDECGKDVEKQPCTECKDEDENGKCDVCGGAVEIDNGEVKLIENGKANFNIIFQSELSEESIELIEALIDELAELGVTVNAARDIPYGIQDCEVLIGSVTSRGEEYVRDVRELGTKGYAVELFGKKVVVSFGSEAVLEDAIESFKIDFLGISPTTESLKNVTVTTDNDFVEVQDDYRIKTLSINGEDMRGFTISADKNDENEYATALSIQDMFYNKTGYWLEIVPHSESGKTVVIKLVPRTGDVGFYVNVEGDKLLVTCEYFTCIKKETETYFNNKIARAGGTGILNFTSSDNTSVNVRDVYYKDFGALGNGKTDDSEAIRACHEYANQAGHTVVAEYGANYYIGLLKTTIYIKTNVDWRDATFTIDDSGITPDSGYRGVEIFTIPSPGTISVEGLTEWRKSVNANGGLDASTFAKIPLTFGEGAFIVLSDSNHKNYIRYGVNENSGTTQQEVILVDKDGNVDPTTPLMFDYEQVTGITVYKIDVEPLLIQGGRFNTSPYLTDKQQQYTAYGRGLKCSRSNVTFKNIRHYLENEGSYNYSTNTGDYGCPYGGFYITVLCNNVRYENCVASAHVVYKGTNGAGMGTYDVDPSRCTNIVYKNCYQEDGNFFDTDAGGQQRWGIMGSSGCKNITFDGSKLTRFDAHNGVHNVYLIDSTLRMIRIDGTGTFYMEGCTLYGTTTFVGLREDYGGFWHGNIILKDNTIISTSASLNLFTNTWYNHYFGYPAAFPTNIIIDNLQVYQNEYKTPYLGTVNLFGSGILNGADKSIQNYISQEGNKYSDGSPILVANKCQVPPPERVVIRNTSIDIVLPDKEAYPWFENTVFSVNEATACTQHIDIDGDLICDDCSGVSAPCTEHSDINSDGYCTYCNKDVAIPCSRHTDRDSNGECDTCRADYSCPSHADQNKNHICDVCDAPLCHDEHYDANKDSKCDVCKGNIK